MNIPQLNEEAFVRFLKSAEAAITTVPVTQIYKSCDSADASYESSETTLKMPCVIVEAEPGEPFATPARNERGRVRVSVITQRDTETETDHHTRCAEVFALLYRIDIAERLSDLEDYHCGFVRVSGSTIETKTQRHLRSSLELEVWSVDAHIS